MPSHPCCLDTDRDTLELASSLTPAEHDLPITGAQEGAARACAWRGSWLCACMCVCACTCLSVCMCSVHAHVCLCMFVCVQYVWLCWGHGASCLLTEPFSAAVRHGVLNEAGFMAQPHPEPEPADTTRLPPHSQQGPGKKELITDNSKAAAQLRMHFTTANISGMTARRQVTSAAACKAGSLPPSGLGVGGVGWDEGTGPGSGSFSGQAPLCLVHAREALGAAAGNLGTARGTLWYLTDHPPKV